MRPVDLPAGTATSIGSLPHTDPARAADFVLDLQSWLPAAPSLPCRSPLEGMIAQAAWGIPGVTVGADGALDIDPEGLDGEPSDPVTFDGEPFRGLQAFLDLVVDRQGPVKLQLTGPVTLGLALHAAGLDAPRSFAVAGHATRQRARALIALAQRRLPGTPLVVFVDEPGLTGAIHPGFPIAPDQTIDLVSSTLAAIEPHAVTGLHCCGAADWRMVLQAGPQILSAPVDAGLDHAPGAISAFLDGGGWVAWGAVPTDEPIGTTADRLWRRLSDLWCELVRGGCDPVRLRGQALVTPACGLAFHGESQAAGVLTLARQVAQRVHDQAIGVRLSAGA
jgi:hypothetical protein